MSYQPGYIYQFGPYKLNAAERLLSREDQVISLQPKIFDLLAVLVINHGRLLEKDELMKLVWPDSIVEEANLANNISILRKTLQEGNEQYIETVPKHGYRFVAEVREIASDRSIDGGRTPTTLNKFGKTTLQSSLFTRLYNQFRTHKLFVGIVLTVLIAVAILWGYRASEKRKASVAFREMEIRRVINRDTVFEAAISPDEQFIAYIAGTTSVGGDQSLWIKHLTENWEKPLIQEQGFRYRGLAFSPDGIFIYYSQRHSQEIESVLYRIPALGGAPQKLLVGVDSAISFSPGGDQLAFVREDKSIGESVVMISNASGTGERKLAVCQFPDSYSVDGPSWSADGKLIAVAKLIPSPNFHFRLTALRVSDGKEQPIGKTLWNWLMRVAWLKDGSGLVAVGRIKSGGTNNQIWLVNYPDGQLRRITNDLNSYRNLHLTSDTTKLVTVQSEVKSNIWVVETKNPSNSMQVTKDSVSQNGANGLDWTPNGKIVYTSLANGSQSIWVMNANGSQRRQITNNGNDMDIFPSVSSDGSYIVFASTRSGPSRLWRVEMDGDNLTELTKGKIDMKPNCSPDGKWIVYSSEDKDKRVIVKMSLLDGITEEVTLNGQYANCPVVSPDSRLIACLFQDKTASPLKVAIIPISSQGSFQNNFISFLSIPNTHPRPSLRWHPDGKSLSYLDPRENSTNVWLFPLAGGAPTKLTAFQNEQIFAYSWSRDGNFLACARGTINRNVVMISHFR